VTHPGARSDAHPDAINHTAWSQIRSLNGSISKSQTHEDSGATAKYLIQNRDAKFPPLFDEILAQAGIHVVLSKIRVPRMNSVMERWVQTCGDELLDRTLIWN